MNVFSKALIIVAGASAIVAPTFGWENNLQARYGQASYSGSEWGDYDNQSEFAISYDGGMDNWPVNIAVSGLFSAESKNSVDVGVYHLNVGARRYQDFGDSGVFINYGGGISFISALIDSTTTETDSTTGFYAEAGIGYAFTEVFSIGANFTYVSAGDVKPDNSANDLDVSGTHITAGVGFHF